MPRRLHLLPWDQPLLGRAVGWLTQDWTGTGPLDLSGTVVVVPTRHSGRRLREALAVCAAARHQAVFPPRVLQPERLLDWEARDRAATRLESLLAWTQVLLAMNPEEFREVFPLDPPGRNFAWALRFATQLLGVQGELGEGGLGFPEVAGRAGDFPEGERWGQLAALEQRWRRRLAEAGRTDPRERCRAALQSGPPADVRRVVLLATPDPQPIGLLLLERWAERLPVDVVVFGPAGGEELFDPWGRPRAEIWSRREPAWDDFAGQVHLCAEPIDQAERVAGGVRQYGRAEGRLAVGTADREVLPFLQHALGRQGVATFDPDGRELGREGLFVLLDSLAALARESSFDAVATLARGPAVLQFLANVAREAGRDFSPARFLAGLDELRGRHLPASLAAAAAFAPEMQREFPDLAPSLAELQRIEAMLVGEAFPAGAVHALETIFSARRLDFSSDEDSELAELAGRWGDLLRELAAAGALAQGLTRPEGWTLVLQLLGEQRRFAEKPAGAVELLGWLELLWEDAPHLVVTGMNDGHVPEAIVGDPFLPESLRVKLGLKSNAGRLARDAYLLAALAACRAGSGRLDLVLGKASAAGDPLRPSRLLLQCPDAELPGRVAQLFRPAEAARASLPWRRAWRLRPRAAPPPERIAVTSFRKYLQCPFRFYLSDVLRMRAVDAEKSEWDAFDFGNLCHGALEAMGRDTGLRDCTDPQILRDFLWTELERRTREQYGAELALPLVVQRASARQRLAKAAEVQARERAAGWVIERVEWKFPQDPACTLGGLVIRGKIDRIERNELTGRWRVLDYKTSDEPRSPKEAHCRALNRRASSSAVPELARFTLDGRLLAWTDLQLPLYLWALSHDPAVPRDLACGYFQLPRAAGATAVALWEDYSDAWQAAALRCAEAVAAAIRAGQFWPPNEDVAFDDFESLFLRGFAESVEPGAWGCAEGRS
jgi:ATP-dependent helicase/nuclease subunit B